MKLQILQIVLNVLNLIRASWDSLHLRLSPVEALQAVLVAPLGVDELLNRLRVGQPTRSVALVVLVALVDTCSVVAGLLINIFNLYIRSVLIFLISRMLWQMLLLLHGVMPFDFV